METTTMLLAALIGCALLAIGYVAGKKIGRVLANKRWERELPKLRAESAKRSRAVIGGQFSEQLAPFLPGFTYKPTEARFLGKPVDFLVFKGLDNRVVDEIVFVEVKSGRSQLSPVEKSVRAAVKQGKVRWEEYRVPEEITKEKTEDL